MPFKDPARQRQYLRAWRATRRKRVTTVTAQLAQLQHQAQLARSPEQLALLVAPLIRLVAQLAAGGTPPQTLQHQYMCPKCRQLLQDVPGQPERLYCALCRVAYRVPTKTG